MWQWRKILGLRLELPSRCALDRLALRLLLPGQRCRYALPDAVPDALPDAQPHAQPDAQPYAQPDALGYDFCHVHSGGSSSDRRDRV